MALIVGTRFGPYEILSQLGAGGMGEVYRARDSRLARDVALKVLPAGMLADDAARRRFRREAMALARLAHPHIAAVFDVGVQDGVDYLVMELVPGRTLADMLKSGPLAEVEVVAFGMQVATALEEAHEHDIVHRDLKPGNILVTPRQQAKLLDFGLASLRHLASDASLVETVTASEGLFGTLPYMAPEQLLGRPADARADLYSLGAVLYEMGTGARPFAERLAPALTDAILHRPPPPPRTLQPGLSAELERIVLKCLEKAPEDRYPSARELTVALRRLAAPTSATIPSAHRNPTRVPRGAFHALWGVPVLILLLLFATDVSGVRRRLLRPPDAARLRAVAVLPLENLSPDPKQTYFSEAMTEEVTSELASLRSLSVISHNSTIQYRGTAKSLREIASELNVDAVVGGSVLRIGDQVRITVQLVDGKTDKTLWSSRYDRRADDVLGVQQEVARAVAHEVRLVLTPAEARRLESPATHNPQAYEAFLRATYYLNTATQSAADADTCIAQAERAVALDPNFAEAYTLLANAYGAKLFSGKGGLEDDEKAFVAVGKALALDPNLAEAYAARAGLYYGRLHGFDIARSVADDRRAIALNPNLASVHGDLGATLIHAGLHARALEELRAALRLDPQDRASEYRIGRALWQSQRFPEALEAYERYGVDGFEKALTLAYLGREADAKATLERIARELAATGRSRGGREEDVAAVRAFLDAREGKAQAAEGEVRLAWRIGQRNDHFHHAAFIIAAAYAEMNRPHDAVLWLRRVADGGMPNYPLFRENPSMLRLRGNPEYEQFMGELKLRWDQLSAGMSAPV